MRVRAKSVITALVCVAAFFVSIFPKDELPSFDDLFDRLLAWSDGIIVSITARIDASPTLTILMVVVIGALGASAIRSLWSHPPAKDEGGAAGSPRLPGGGGH